PEVALVELWRRGTGVLRSVAAGERPVAAAGPRSAGAWTAPAAGAEAAGGARPLRRGGPGRRGPGGGRGRGGGGWGGGVRWVGWVGRVREPGSQCSSGILSGQFHGPFGDPIRPSGERQRNRVRPMRSAGQAPTMPLMSRKRLWLAVKSALAVAIVAGVCVQFA